MLSELLELCITTTIFKRGEARSKMFLQVLHIPSNSYLITHLFGLFLFGRKHVFCSSIIILLNI